MSKHDQEILDTIETVLNEQPPTTHPPESLAGFSSLLMGAGSKADPQFQSRLKAQLLQKLETAESDYTPEWQRTDTYTVPGSHYLPTDPAYSTQQNRAGRRLLKSKNLAGLLVVLVLVGGLLFSIFASNVANNDSQAILDSPATAESVAPAPGLIKSGGVGRLTELDQSDPQSNTSKSSNTTTHGSNSAPYQLRMPFLMYQMI